MAAIQAPRKPLKQNRFLEFSTVFEKHQGLPTKRDHKHQIILRKEGIDEGLLLYKDRFFLSKDSSKHASLLQPLLIPPSKKTCFEALYDYFSHTLLKFASRTTK